MAKNLKKNVKLKSVNLKNEKLFNIEKWYPWILAIFSVVGFMASFILTIEKFAILKDPTHKLSCSINPLLRCGPIITSPEASTFGFSNTLIGLFAFSALFTVAMGMFAGSIVKKEARWYWNLYIIGHLFGLSFIIYLMQAAFYDLQALCIYCMIAWAATIPLNWYGFLWMTKTDRLKINSKVTKFRDWGLKNHWGFVVACYVLVFILIFFAFRSYFESVWF